MSPALRGTLDRVAEAAAGLTGPWWVFGSAAALLLGLDGLEPADVDLLAAPAEALALLERLGAPPQPKTHPRFRSEVFGTVADTPLPVEVIGGFSVRTGEGWTRVRPQTRVLVGWGDLALAVPAAHEQARFCRLLGRPRDLERAARLDALG